MDRRNFLSRSAAALTLTASGTSLRADQPVIQRPNRIVVSTYSFWQFRNAALRDIETCIDLAADMGFDGVEILHRQMQNESNDYLQRLKRRLFVHGIFGIAQ